MYPADCRESLNFWLICDIDGPKKRGIPLYL